MSIDSLTFNYLRIDICWFVGFLKGKSLQIRVVENVIHTAFSRPYSHVLETKWYFRSQSEGLITHSKVINNRYFPNNFQKRFWLQIQKNQLKIPVRSDFHMNRHITKEYGPKFRKKYRLLRTILKFFIQTKQFISKIWDFMQYIPH